MNLRANAPGLIILGVIALGLFGILRIAFIRHDPIGLLSIVLSLALFAAFRHLSVKRVFDVPKWPIPLASNACEIFTVFPGRPEGYAGYTDYTAMSIDVNDDLVTRSPTEQYALLGFGVGFLNGVYQQLAGRDPTQRFTVRSQKATRAEREYLGWLVYLQKSGTDNAGPSTANLNSVVQSVSVAVCTNGPITMKFWDKVQNKKAEGLDVSGTSLEAIEQLKDTYQHGLLQGEELALAAVISAEPA